MARLSDDASTRSLFEVALGFLGALLIVPLLFKTVGLAFRMTFGVLGGVFRTGLFRRLLGEAALVGVTTLLTREDVLDRVFGRQGRDDGALLKSDTDR